MDYSQYYRYYTRLEPVMKRPEIRAYTTLTLSVFAAALAILFAVRPGIERMATINKTIKEREAKNIELTEKLQNLQAANNVYDARVKPKLAVLDNALPKEPNFTSLLINIEQRLDEAATPMLSVGFNQIDLRGVTEVKKKTTAQVDPAQTQLKPLGKQTPLDFTLSVTGSYDGIKTLLTGLYKLDRIVYIENIDIARPDLKAQSATQADNIPQGEYNLSLKGQSYYQR